jgi:hypothetical protein
MCAAAGATALRYGRVPLQLAWVAELVVNPLRPGVASALIIVDRDDRTLRRRRREAVAMMPPSGENRVHEWCGMISSRKATERRRARTVLGTATKISERYSFKINEVRPRLNLHGAISIRTSTPEEGKRSPRHCPLPGISALRNPFRQLAAIVVRPLVGSGGHSGTSVCSSHTHEPMNHRVHIDLLASTHAARLMLHGRSGGRSG